MIILKQFSFFIFINFAFIHHVLITSLGMVSKLVLPSTNLHIRFIINCIFQGFISLFLNLLRILQLFNKCHLQHFHLHHLSFLLSNSFFLFCYLSGYILTSCFLLTSSKFIDLCSLYLLLSPLLLHFNIILLFHLHQLLLLSCFILLTNIFSLFCFFLFV